MTSRVRAGSEAASYQAQLELKGARVQSIHPEYPRLKKPESCLRKLELKGAGAQPIQPEYPQLKR